ncbi:MAG: DUF1795 domain-containing protein [Paracoccus sp. (in: a-proteobacteria)]|nr:DUF1795 domain-containing protein [Paracoccus sp. (in: a-proteobacteria)]
MYVMNEATIELPANWRDQSINVISSNAPMQQGMTLTVTRDDLPFGMSFNEYLEDQVREVGKLLTEYKLLGRQQVMLDGIAAAEIECTWLSKEAAMHQIIYMLPLPSGRAMVVTASMPGRMTESQQQEIRRLVQTIRFRR